MERRCTERGEASVKKRILLGLISVFKALYNAVYAVMKLRPMQKKVVMISRQSNSQRPDFEQLGAEIEARDPGVRLVYLCREMGDTPLELLRYCFHLLHCAAELSTAHVCIIDGYCIPVSVLHHRKELRVVQVWHALGAIKKFGRQALSVPGGRDKELAERMGMHKHYDAVLCASHRTAKAYEEAFGVSADKMRVTGVPRVDAILKMNRARCRRRFFAAYPELREQTVIIESFSKPWSMTGWRLGWLAAAAPVIAEIAKAHQYLVSSAVSFEMDAAARALTVDPTPMLKVYRARRERVLAALSAMGLDVVEPAGAFYAFPSIKKFGLTSEDFCIKAIKEANVALVPGDCFGTEGHIRLSYCVSDQDLDEGLNRLSTFISTL